MPSASANPSTSVLSETTKFPQISSVIRFQRRFAGHQAESIKMAQISLWEHTMGIEQQPSIPCTDVQEPDLSATALFKEDQYA
ncbi:hypothetical protein BT69DRAFT_1276814 [Atractiella rhizophila]|nr:hypothetical protein BT69DRAFT_1276814 [Atractiella rhizophila]